MLIPQCQVLEVAFLTRLVRSIDYPHTAFARQMPVPGSSLWHIYLGLEPVWSQPVRTNLAVRVARGIYHEHH